MHITLSQKEITAAVRQYVAQKGIGAGFTLSDVKFSATRNPAGFSAELVLEETNAVEAPVPTIVQAAAEVKATTANTVAALVEAAAVNADTTPAPTTEPVDVEEVKSAPEEVVQAAEAPVADEPAAVEAETPVVNTSSLFG